MDNVKWICAVGIVLIIATAVFGVCIDDEPDIFQCRRLKPGVTESDNECCNIIKTHDYKYEHFFPISKRDNGNIELTFRVKGDRDANLLFSSNVFPQDGDPAHEIIFSAATSWLRIAKNNETGRVDASSEEARVSPNEWREFWVKINGKTVQVGRKEKEASLVSSNSIDVPIKYYSVAGHSNANVLWSLPCIEEKDFSKLKRLNIGGNDLTRVPTGALHTLESLKKLEIQENRIVELREGDFQGMKNLDMLILAHNQLKYIPAKVFANLTVLNSLELDGNHIISLDEEAFYGLEENLQYLRLGDNNLHEIPSNALRRLHKLRHLDLRANNISFINDDAFTGYGDTITFLNLQKNNIKTLPALAFENLNSLEILNLQNNKLTFLNEEPIEPILDTLRTIDVSDNPLICDCGLTWYQDWLLNKRNKDDETNMKKRTICSMPNEHREYNIQKLPVDKMKCLVRNGGFQSTTGIATAISASKLLPWLATSAVMRCF